MAVCFYCKKNLEYFNDIRICRQCLKKKDIMDTYLDIRFCMSSSKIDIKFMRKEKVKKYGKVFDLVKKGIVITPEKEKTFMIDRLNKKSFYEKRRNREDRSFLRKEKMVCEKKAIRKKINNKKLTKEWGIESLNDFCMQLYECGIKVKDIPSYKKILSGNFSNVLDEFYSEDRIIKFPEIMRRNFNRKKLRASGIKAEEHQLLVWKVIRKKFPMYLESESLKEQAYSAGIEGLSIATGTFDNKISGWSTFAWNWIEGKIKRHFQNNNPDSLIRVPCNQQKKENRDFIKTLNTLSLEKEMDESSEEKTTLECFVGDAKEVDREVFFNNLKEHLTQKYGKEHAESFFLFTLHGKRWLLNKKVLEAMLNEVKTKFLSDGKFF